MGWLSHESRSKAHAKKFDDSPEVRKHELDTDIPA